MNARFIVLRHGETEWNVASRIQGHQDSALTPRGLVQAEALAQRMVLERFDRLVASDLGRAHETARIIAARTGHAVQGDARLRERCYGTAEGLTYGELDHEFPEVFSSVRVTDPDYVVPGGESRRQFYDRVQSAFEALAREHPGERIAVVSHGGVLASLFRLVHGIAVSVPHRIPMPNAAFNALAFEAGQWTVENWGDINHLATGGALLSGEGSRETL
ncbi:histidine phosphatase family protein [Usitatibacter palustris]|uniref:Phosphoserine phosphatase 2 n=1 Tax=Usitatibacter palustris TaxID=2732487 RepID=A0A6M4HAP7_9PROT|nr:histidine phosphatase family protein [Usitatibacter palustris]QJR15504.1 Putative phosphoserine phosphatase 2 [Usitatibacter palustris]